MKLYNLVFQNLEELLTHDASIKFALCSLIESERFSELKELMLAESDYGGVEGVNRPEIPGD